MITVEEIKAKVEASREEILDCLREVLQTPSVTGQEAEIGKVFCRRIEKHTGLKPTVYEKDPGRPNILAEWFGSQPGKRFIFNGHMDHFPPPEGKRDTYGPYSGKLVDGKMYGRGASDMKSGDVSALFAVALLKRMGFDPKGSVLLSYMSDEENGGVAGSAWMCRQNLLNGDYGVCMEATTKRLKLRACGTWRATFTYVSDGCNSYREHPKKSALEKSILAINALYKLREDIRKRTNEYGDKPVFSVTTLHAGEATNMHAAVSVFTVDRRLIVGEDEKAAGQEVLDVLNKLKAEDSDMDYSYELISAVPTFLIPENGPVVKASVAAYKEVTGRDLVFWSSSAGADASIIRAYNGIEMPVWSGATGMQASGPDEHIVIEDMLECIQYFMVLLIKLLS